MISQQCFLIFLRNETICSVLGDIKTEKTKSNLIFVAL